MRHWLIAIALMAAVAAGCDKGPPIAEGQPCVFCEGPGGYYNDCPGLDKKTCETGLVCMIGGTNTCERPPMEGEACRTDVPCAEGLICGVGELCAPISPEGGPCSVLDHCDADLLCNYGAAPDDVAQGKCAPWGGSNEGEPCYWAHAFQSNRWLRAESQGCAAGLSCVPGDRSTFGESGVDPVVQQCVWNLQEPCGHAGVCRAAPELPGGAGCLHDSACASGHCTVSTVPTPVGDPPPGYSCDTVECFEGLWPGICAGVGDGWLGENCAWDVNIMTAPCGAGLSCVRNRCVADYSLVERQRCDPTLGWPDSPPPAPACQPGTRCQGSTCETD